MEKLKLLELFGGIGACSKALERLGIDYEIADYVEIDKYAVSSYNAIHNTNFEPQDITTWDKDIEVDMIMHGSPCQDFSLAGKQAGGDAGSGTRSSLMYETIRIVKKLKPKYVIWENVKNLLSKKHRHNFDSYLKIMKELGYTNYYQVLNAKDYGIPQNRERVFTISILDGGAFEFPQGIECENKIQVVGNYMPSGHDASRIVNEEGLAPTVKENHGTVTAVARNFEFPQKQELKLKLKDLLEDEVDEKYYLSEELINRIRYKFDEENHLLEGLQEHQSIKKDGIRTTLTSSMGTGGGYVPMVLRKYGIFDDETSKHQAGSVYDKNGLCPTIDTMQGGWRQPCIEIKNATKKSETRRGRVGKQVSQTLQCNDNIGVIVNKICETRYDEGIRTFKNDICGTIRTIEAGGNKAVLNYPPLRIRKLTPKECWRLMGFDDVSFEKAEKVNSNSQLYKQAGNSIVVNVLESVLSQLLLNDK